MQSTSRSAWIHRTAGCVRTCCGWSGRHSRAPGQNENCCIHLSRHLKLPLAFVLLWLVVLGATASPESLFARTNLVAWCIVPFDARKRGPEERAAMLERLGLKKFAYDYRAEHIPTFDAEMEALRRHGIELERADAGELRGSLCHSRTR